ncbi:MAG: inorganic phosphate transporter, partial [Halobacteriaceae archaeon]
RTTTVGEAVRGEAETTVTVDALAAERPDEVPKMGEEEADELTAADLFDPSATARVVILWILTPSLSAGASFVLFRLLSVL